MLKINVNNAMTLEVGLILMEKLSKIRSFSKINLIEFQNDAQSLNDFRLSVDLLFKKNSGIRYIFLIEYL